MSRLRVVAAGLVVLGFALTSSAENGFKLVAHPSISTDSLTARQASDIFLKKSDKWPDGTQAVPVDQGVDSRVRAAFSEAIHRKSASSVDAYWQRRVFAGRGVPPVTQGGDGQVLNYVSSTPGAIGYVSPGASTQGVKVITVR